MIIILIIISWLILGATGFLYWWTKDCNFTTREIPLLIFVMFLGPSNWIFGAMIHGNRNNSIILRKRR